MKSVDASIMGDKALYIRIPEDVEELTVMGLGLSKECSGKTLMIKIIDNGDAPFERDAVHEKTDDADLTYLGDKREWNPKPARKVVVDGHPNCLLTECNGNCHVVSCSIHQGYAKCVPLEIRYLRSDKVK